MIFAVATLLAFVVSNILNRLKDLKELQEKSTIENIQFEIESGLADLAEKMQRFNDEVADWDDDNQKVSFSEFYGPSGLSGVRSWFGENDRLPSQDLK